MRPELETKTTKRGCLASSIRAMHNHLLYEVRAEDETMSRSSPQSAGDLYLWLALEQP
jgi:hypothetical protein